MKKSQYFSKLIYLPLVMATFLMSGIVHAYEEISVKNGASISGIVSLSGPVPPPFRYKLTMGAYPQHCEPIATEDGNVLLPRARVSKSHTVADVVVFIQEIEKGKASAAKGPKLSVNRCQFDHLVMAGMDGSHFSVQMNDTVLHPLRGWEMLNKGRIPLFHFPNLATGEEKSAELKTRQSGMVMVECDQHRFMQAWILVPLNPYFSTSDVDGRFMIDQIPAGTYTLSAWHPTLGYLEQTLTVTAKEYKTTDFRFQTTKLTK